MGRVQELEQEILRHRNLYYNSGDPEINDFEYDRLERELKGLDPDSEVLKRTGVEAPPSEWLKLDHSFFVGSLSKAMDLDELEKWAEKFLVQGVPLHCSDKLDGSSIVVYYERGVAVSAGTRGDGVRGEDIFSNVEKMEGFHKVVDGFSGSLRGEIILKHSVFKEHFQDKVNPRNAANGAAKELKGSKAQHLSLRFYGVREDGMTQRATSEQFRWLELRGIPIARVLPIDNFEDFEEVYEGICKERGNLGYDIDGLVFWVDQLDAEERYGHSNDHRPRAAVALKFPAEEKTGVIKDIRWDMGLGGRLTPVAVLEESLFLAGASITNVSLHNLDVILEHEVHIGAQIGVVRSGDVIPYMTRVVAPLFDPETSLNPFWVKEAMRHEGSPATPGRFREAMGMVNLESIKFPQDCPECRGATQVRDAYVYCESRECPGNKRGKIIKWVTSLGLKNVGEGLITQLVALGKVNDPADLYTLTVGDVEAADRKSSKHYEKARAALEAKKELTLVEFMAALGIPYAGKRAWTSIQATGVETFEQVEALTPEAIAQGERLGEKRAESIHQELQVALVTARKLLSVGITLKKPVEGGKFSGKSFCISGSVKVEVDGKKANKKVLGGMIEEKGGRMESGVSKTLDYLILADPSSTSSKAVKARKYGTRILSAEEMMGLLV